MRVWIDVTNSPHVLSSGRWSVCSRRWSRRLGHRARLRPDARVARGCTGSRTPSSGRSRRRRMLGKGRAMGARLPRSPSLRQGAWLRPRAGPRVPRTHPDGTDPRVPAQLPTTTSSRRSAPPRPAARDPGRLSRGDPPRRDWPASGRDRGRSSATRGSRRSTTSPLRARPGSAGPRDRPGAVLVVVRTPPEVSLYHRHGSPLFADVLERLGGDPSVHAIVLPRTSGNARRCSLALPSLLVPEHAVDAQSLVAWPISLCLPAGR